MTKVPIKMEVVKTPEFLDRKRAVKDFFIQLNALKPGESLRQTFATYQLASTAGVAIYSRLKRAEVKELYKLRIRQEGGVFALYLIKLEL